MLEGMTAAKTRDYVPYDVFLRRETEAYKKLVSLEQYFLVSQDERRFEVRTRQDKEWITAAGGAAETVRIHGRDVGVDAIYA
jgi:hypothetical protein